MIAEAIIVAGGLIISAIIIGAELEAVARAITNASYQYKR